MMGRGDATAAPHAVLRDQRPARPAAVAIVMIGAGVALGRALAADSPAIAAAGTAAVLFAAFAIARMDLALLAILVARGLTNLLPGGSGLAVDASAGLLVFVTLLGVAYLLVHKVDALRAPTIVPHLTFVALALVASAITPARAYSMPYWARVAGFLVIFLLAWCSTTTRARLVRLLWAIVAAGVVTAFSAVRDFLTHKTRVFEFQAQLGLPRIEGAFGSGLGYGTYLIVPLVVAIVLFLEARSRRDRVTGAAAVAVLGPAFLLSFARMPWAGFVLAMLILGALRYRKLPLLVLIGIVVLALAVPGVRTRIASAWSQQNELGTDVAGRVERWQTGVDVFMRRPLLGYGLGAGEALATTLATQGRVIGMLHNDYVRMLVDVGVLGALAFLWLLLAVAGALWRTVRQTRDPALRAVALGAFATWIAFLLIRATGNVATFTPGMFLLWALVGAALAIPEVEAAERAPAATPARVPAFAPVRRGGGALRGQPGGAG